MLVETFEQEEVTSDDPAGIIIDDPAAIELIERLGLKGQQDRVSKDGDSVSPYRHMTQEEMIVYKLLCPKVMALKSYTASKIPLRVLQVASHATELGIFDELSIWDKEDVQVKDPVLVGKLNGKYQWCILARWGEELDAFDVMRRAALNKLRDRLADYKAEVLRAIRLIPEGDEVTLGCVDVNAWNVSLSLKGFSLPSALGS